MSVGTHTHTHTSMQHTSTPTVTVRLSKSARSLSLVVAEAELLAAPHLVFHFLALCLTAQGCAAGSVSREIPHKKGRRSMISAPVTLLQCAAALFSFFNFTPDLFLGGSASVRRLLLSPLHACGLRMNVSSERSFRSWHNRPNATVTSSCVTADVISSTLSESTSDVVFPVVEDPVNAFGCCLCFPR